jgi:PAS domain S-box-containing protein
VPTPVPTLLEAWRAAERRWEETSPEDPAFAEARSLVLDAWVAYQEAVGYLVPDEVVLIADDGMRYVSANAEAHRVLGYGPGELIGLAVADLTPTDDGPVMRASWDEFRRTGRQDGQYTLRRRDGSTVAAKYIARAHLPVAGLHTARLRIVE